MRENKTRAFTTIPIFLRLLVHTQILNLQSYRDAALDDNITMVLVLNSNNDITVRIV